MLKTEEEKRAFELGKDWTKLYLMRCICESSFDLGTVNGLTTFLNFLAPFLNSKTDYIPNKDGLKFSEFFEKYGSNTTITELINKYDYK